MIIDTINIRLDSISIKKIEPKWIKKIEVLKEQKDKDIYGNKVECILMYPKKRYRTKIIKLLNF